MKVEGKKVKQILSLLTPSSIEKAKAALPNWKPTKLEDMLIDTCKWCEEAWHKYPEERKWSKFSEEAVKELERSYQNQTN